jgi:hypothetical protein
LELGSKCAILSTHLLKLFFQCGRIKFMKFPFFSIVLFLGLTFVPLLPATAQDSIFRCGNEYTNNAADAKARGCKTLQGGNITIVQGTKPASTASGVRVASSTPSMAVSPPSAPRVDASEQRNRDTGARAILETELKRTEARQAELQREYNNGEPEKTGGEARNYQKYIDRVAELKANLARNDEDIAGLRRELARLPSGK